MCTCARARKRLCACAYSRAITDIERVYVPKLASLKDCDSSTDYSAKVAWHTVSTYVYRHVFTDVYSHIRNIGTYMPSAASIADCAALEDLTVNVSDLSHVAYHISHLGLGILANGYESYSLFSFMPDRT